MVLTQSDFYLLSRWGILPVAIGLVLGSLCVGNMRFADTGADDAGLKSRAFTGAPWQIVWSLFVLPVIAIVLRLVDAPYWSVWLALLSSAVVVFRTASIPVANHPETLRPEMTSQRVGIVALIIFGAVLTAITHRPDLDDAQYLNFVVTALDFPSEPLYARSGLWQDPDVALELPIYRFHTYELLIATLSNVFGIQHKLLYYLILAPMFGAVAVLVQWRLACYLAPTYALSIVLVWLVLTIALGESHRELGNFAFVRLFQGKAILVTVALPLCLLLGLRFAEVPDWRRALALAMAVVASLGMSSSALVAVPFVVAAALGGGLLGASRASIMRILVGGLVSLCLLVAIGVFLWMTINPGGTPIEAESMFSAGSGLSTVLGEGVLGAVILALFPLAPVFLNAVKRRRLYATTTLIYVIAVLNPWTAPLLGKLLDSALLWRLFWSVPFLVSASICLAALAALTANQIPGVARWVVLPILLAALLLSSGRLSISPDNAVVIALPRYKVEPFDHEIAAQIVRDAPQRSTIYAPISVAHLITTFRLHPYPLIVRPEYLGFERIRSHFGDAELDRRRRVIAFLEGSDASESTAAFFALELVRDHPSVVTYRSDVATAPLISPMLSAAGYIGEKRGIYRLWRLPEETAL